MAKLTMKDTPWAVDILKNGAEILDGLAVKWWLSAGTMLGIHREGKLIDHDDPDVDVGIQEPANHDLIKEAFLNNHYKVYAEGVHQIVFKKDKVLFDIYFYERIGSELVCDIYGLGKIVKPYKLFKQLGTVTFNCKKYPTPQPVDEYLTVRYGDWETPKKKKEPWPSYTVALKKY